MRSIWPNVTYAIVSVTVDAIAPLVPLPVRVVKCLNHVVWITFLGDCHHFIKEVVRKLFALLTARFNVALDMRMTSEGKCPPCLWIVVKENVCNNIKKFKGTCFH
jgi:hypothetical protein